MSVAGAGPTSERDNGARTGRYKVLVAPATWRNGAMSRADVADFVVQQIEDRTFLLKAPVLAC